MPSIWGGLTEASIIAGRETFESLGTSEEHAAPYISRKRKRNTSTLYNEASLSQEYELQDSEDLHISSSQKGKARLQGIRPPELRCPKSLYTDGEEPKPVFEERNVLQELLVIISLLGESWTLLMSATNLGRNICCRRCFIKYLRGSRVAKLLHLLSPS